MADHTTRDPARTRSADRPSRGDLRIVAAERFGDRRRAEPAAAPFETDAEAGAESPGEGRTDPVPRHEPAKTYAVNSDGVAFPDISNDDRRQDRSDVRAGPGDAGKQLRPMILESGSQAPRPKSSSYIVMILLALGAVLVAILAAALL